MPTHNSHAVHPEDSYATRHEGGKLGNRVWYILTAEPEARLSTASNSTDGQSTQAIQNVTLDRLLYEERVQAGMYLRASWNSPCNWSGVMLYDCKVSTSPTVCTTMAVIGIRETARTTCRTLLDVAHYEVHARSR